MNRTKIILIALLALAFAVIAVKKFVNFSDVPSVKKIEGNPDEIFLKGRGTEVKLAFRDGRWLVSDLYRGDVRKCAELVGRISKFSLEEKVGSGEDYARFNLDDENAIFITVNKNQKQLLSLAVGKSVQGSRLSFVRIGENRKVFLADGISASDVKTSVDDYRDRSIVTFAKNKIEKITASGADISFEITAQSKDSAVIFSMKNTMFTAGGPKVEAFVGALAGLKADKFLSARPEGKPIAVFDITSEGKSVRLDFYPPDNENFYPVLSSVDGQSFAVSSSRAEAILRKNRDYKGGK